MSKSTTFASVCLGLLILGAPVFSHAATFERFLSVGSQGADVSALQHILQQEGYYTHPRITGYYGSLTAQAVKQLQLANGLEGVGYVGPGTRSLLNSARFSAMDHSSHGQTQAPASASPSAYASAPTPALLMRTLDLGARGADVSVLQQFLKDKGYYSHPNITGYYGAVTKAAVAAFQTGNNIKPVGAVGPLTRAFINGLLGSTVSSNTATANTSTAVGKGSSVTTSFAPKDSTAPIITITGPSSVFPAGTQQAVVSASTNEAATCVYGTAANKSYTSMRAFSSTGAATHTVTVSGLQDATPYSYYVKCKDAAGNVGDASVSFSVSAPPVSPVDTTSPSAPSGLTAVVQSASKVTLSWSASTDDRAVTGYQVFVNGGAAAITQTTSLTYDHLGLSGSTPYSYTVKAIDAAGNLSPSSNTASATTLVQTDATPPSVSITAPLNTLAVGSTQTTLSATTNEASSCAYSTQSGTSFGSMTAFGSTGNLLHAATLSGLANSTSYTYYVKCRDTAGNASGNASITFSVATPTDTNSPAITTPNTFPIIASNFNINDWITSGHAIAPKDKHTGAFRFICNVSKLGNFDPIVFPGQSTAGHLHTFFGNTQVDKDSTYESLRKAGDSSCQGGPLNRSAYWMPSILREDGKVVIPQHVSIYYKGIPKTSSDPFALTHDLPHGLRFVFDGAVPRVDSRVTSPHWLCNNPDGTATQTYTSITDLLKDPVGCKDGGEIYARGASPPCWDGRFDSPDHRSHMAYPGYGSWGYSKCPATHPHRIVQFTFSASHKYDNAAELATWYLASDRMAGQPVKPSGSTLHFDWYGAWDDTIKKTWETHCIENYGNCAGFQLGNGTAGKYPATFTFNQQPRLWDPPANATVIVAPDTSAPSVPADVRASVVSNSSVSVSWNASSDDRQVTGYQVFRNGTLITTTVSRNFSDTDLQPSTAYTYTVKATDLAGNVSAASAPSTATTLGATAVNAEWAATASAVQHLGYGPRVATFSNISIGEASPNRIVVVGVGNGNPAHIISEVKIGGISATKAVEVGKNAVWYAEVPSGTNADVVITGSGSAFGLVGISVGKITGASLAPARFATYNPGAVRGPHTISSTVPVGGVGVVFGVDGYRGTMPSWTGATGDSEAHDATGNTMQVMIAHTPTGGLQTVSLAEYDYSSITIVLAVWEAL